MNMKAKHTVAVVLVLLGLIVGRDALAFYNPQTGRWLSRDPIGEKGGMNNYASCRNTPLGFIDARGRIPLGPFWPILGDVCDAARCWAHLHEIRDQATDAANQAMNILDPNYDEEETGPDHEGSNADALRHCIGACMAVQNPGACPPPLVPYMLQRRERGPGLNHQMDRTNNRTGVGILGDCVQGCTEALRSGQLSCFQQGDTVLSPCRLP